MSFEVQAVGMARRDIAVWDTETGEVIASLMIEHCKPPGRVIISADCPDEALEDVFDLARRFRAGEPIEATVTVTHARIADKTPPTFTPITKGQTK